MVSGSQLQVAKLAQMCPAAPSGTQQCTTAPSGSQQCSAAASGGQRVKALVKAPVKAQGKNQHGAPWSTL